jgi:hypothetical protein
MRAFPKAARCTAWALACACLGSTALGQSPAPADKAGTSSAQKSLGSGKSTARVLTRDELRACLATQDQQRGKREALTRTGAELDKEKADIAAEEAAMQSSLATLDHTSEEAVKAYNQRVQDHGARIDAYNQRNAALSTDATAWQTAQDSWTTNCGDRRYREDDEIAIKRGK